MIFRTSGEGREEMKPVAVELTPLLGSEIFIRLVEQRGLDASQSLAFNFQECLDPCDLWQLKIDLFETEFLFLHNLKNEIFNETESVLYIITMYFQFKQPAQP